MDAITTALAHVFTVSSLLAITIGSFLGITIGAIPGLTPAIGLVLCTPLTYKMETVPAILLLLSIYCAGTYGGSITAILIRTPGTPAAACTVLDGYPLAQRGEAHRALDMALKASTIAGVFSALMLLFIAPQLSKLTIQFSSVEYFMVAVFGMSIIVGISGDDLVKGFLAGGIGLFLSTIGVDQQSASIRYTFGVVRLQSGISTVVIMVGIFALTELLVKAEHQKDQNYYEKVNLGKHKKGISFRELLHYWKTILMSSFIGTIIGALPGTGSTLSSFISYDLAKKRSPHPETYGKGELDGVAACEAANNGVTGATLIPLLTLGIPGDANVAILIGALTIHNITPGPMLFKTQSGTIYAIMFGLIVVNLMMFFQGKYLIRLFAKVSDIPYPILGGLVAFFCLIGAYSSNNSYFNLYLILIFGLLGYVFRKLDIPVVPMMLGLVLGDLVEENFRRAILMSKGNYTIFFTRPISLLFFLLAVASVCYSLYQSRKKKAQKS